MITQEQKIKINSAIDALSNDLDIKEIVNKIETGIKTTQGNYGKYIAVLTHFSQGSKTMLYIIGEGIIN